MIQADKLGKYMEQGPPDSPAPPAAGGGRINESAEVLRAYLESHGASVKETKPDGKGGTVLILAECPMNPEHGHGSDVAVILRADKKVGFKCHHNGCTGVRWTEVRAKIDPDATKRAHKRGGKGPTQSAALVELAADAELFRSGDTAYATVSVNAHRETFSVRSRRFRLWLQRRFYQQQQRSPSSQALVDALGVLESKAVFDGPEQPVFIRLAEHDGAFWLDLGDAEWQAVRIDASGWQLVADPPVKFLRPRGLLALPVPGAGGSLDELREFVNLDGANQWVLVVAWLVAALRPSGPYPLLVVNGEQGSAKSTLCRMLRALVDPSAAPLRAEPKEVRDLVIAANNGWLLAFDNISHVQPWLSDGLCRLATGGGFATRALYTDDEERIFDNMRPTLLNGIEDLNGRPDLLDRAICITLPMIDEAARETEKKLWTAFNCAWPRILGAALSAVSGGMRRLPSVDLDRLPRMADFATWAVACEPGLGLPAGAFMGAYTGNREAVNGLAIESLSVGPAIVGLIRGRGQWTGTAQDLLTELNTRHTTEEIRQHRDWPRMPQRLGGQLRRLAPNLRSIGIQITFERRGKKGARRIIIEKAGAGPSASSALSDNRTGAAKNAVSDGRRGDSLPSAGPGDRQPGLGDNRVAGPETQVADDADAADSIVPASSAGPREVFRL